MALSEQHVLDCAPRSSGGKHFFPFSKAVAFLTEQGSIASREYPFEGSTKQCRSQDKRVQMIYPPLRLRAWVVRTSPFLDFSYDIETQQHCWIFCIISVGAFRRKIHLSNNQKITIYSTKLNNFIKTILCLYAHVIPGFARCNKKTLFSTLWEESLFKVV